MKYHSWRSVLLAGCLFLSACHNGKNEILVVNKNFEDLVEQQQNLVFDFNKDIYPDSLLQRWDSTNYIEFTPAVKGMFKWASSSELVFSPSTGFEPGTDYKAVITKLVLKHAKRTYWLGDKTSMSFHTEQLKVTNTHISWTRSKSMTNVMVQLDVDFNYDVKVDEALKKLKLSSEGKDVNFTATNNGTGKTISLQFLPLNDLDQSTALKISLSQGIPLAQGKYISPKDTVINDSIPSRYNLAITDVTAQHTGTEGMITVFTSQPVLEENLKSVISIEPNLPFDVQTTDGGFIITSEKFKVDQKYDIDVSAAIEGSFGGKLKQPFTKEISFGKLSPSISFVNTKGMYLSSQGYKNLALMLVSVPKVRVSVVKVYQNNLEAFMRNGQRYGYSYGDDDEDGGGGGYEYYRTENLGDTIFKRTYDVSKLPKQNAASILHLDFKDKIKDYDGVYVITVASEDQQWIQQSKILSISDIGLIVKEEKDNIYVFANSIKNASALSGVKVSFISTNNQRLFTATTNSEGMAGFNDISKKSPGFRVGMITANMGDEFTFVWMAGSRVETSRFDVGGRMPNETGLNAMIYPERDLYRPGETIHLSAIIRDEQWENPGEIPVKLKLLMPNGKEFNTVRKILNEEGSCEAQFNMPATTPTGSYTLELYTGNDVLLNTYDISVEEFVPDRIKVATTTNKTEYYLGDTVLTTIQADNLFGTPAAGRNYECVFNLTKTVLQPKNYTDYNFRIENEFNFEPDTRTGQTDEKGAEKIDFVLGDKIQDVGLLDGKVSATVFDETGRPVHRYANFKVYTNKTFLGIKRFDSYVSTRSPIKIGLIAVNKDGTALNNVDAQVTIVKTEWHTVIQQDGDGYKYVSQKEEKIVSTRNIRISGASTTFYYTPLLSGDYEVKLSLPGSESYVSREFYAWGWDDTQYTSFEVNNEGNVDIKPDKPKYNLGNTINLLFTAPFEGKMLVTLERDHMIKYYYLTTKDKSASLTVNADEVCVPNVYISATLIRPMDGSDMPLTVAHGYISIPVENAQNHVHVTVNVAAKSRSKTKQTITVKTMPDAYVTIAAVDEGILQVKNFETPDPYDYFYQKVALSVNSYDIYPLLLPEIKTTRSSTGGDGGEETSMRVNPMFVNRIKNVSFWSGIIQADANGVARYNIDIPQFSGDIRVMACAYKDKSFGAFEQHMKVADPIVISTALPRFLSPKDEVVMPVTLSNTTAKDANAIVTVQVTGPLDIKGSSEQNVKIPANREGRAVFNIDAQKAVGACKVLVTVKALGETFTNETEIGVRPPASLQKMTGNGLANENATTIVKMDNKFVPSTYHAKLVVSKSPLVQFTDNLSYLVRYPYGCVEQTTSSAFPQLYYHDLVKSITGHDDDDINPEYNVQQAILKLQSMQMSDGALSYWPGGGYESWWGSVYAAHFLIEARKAGYEVNKRTIDRLTDYMKFMLTKRETEIYFYNDNLRREIAAQEIPYSLYVLALAGQTQLSTMNYYKSHPEMLSPDGKYLQAATYAISGMQQQAMQILPLAYPDEKANHSFGGSFYSYIRDEALALNALLEIDPNNPQVAVMARQLSEQVKHDPYLNTQENAFLVLAFGKIAKAANKTNATASVTVNGKTLVAGQTDISLNMKAYMNQTVQIKVNGKGNYYYFWQTSGITADGSYKQEDSYIRVRRHYYNKDGREISDNNFKQNDLVIVKITLAGEYDRNVDNVVITDMLPAGFEIENPRLTDLPDIKWIKNESEPDYFDVRDDRINFFTSVNGKEKTFYYMVRAVSPGTFQVGPVQADAMYDGTYHSYNGACVVKVNEH
jgi:uncharacterized protein YfaS (alpha-2-macroglobulin family)